MGGGHHSASDRQECDSSVVGTEEVISVDASLCTGAEGDTDGLGGRARV